MKKYRSILLSLICILNTVFFAHSQNAPVTTISSLAASPGTIITLQVTQTNLVAIAGLGLRFNYDASVLSFVNPNPIQQVGNFYNTNSAMYANGGDIIGVQTDVIAGITKKLTIYWGATIGAVTPSTTSGTAVICDLQFRYYGGNTTVVFDNSSGGGQNCEYADAAANPYIDIPTASYYNNGSVTQGGLTISTIPASISASPSTICYGSFSTLSFTGGTLGSGASWNWYSGSCPGAYVTSSISPIVGPALSSIYYLRAEGTLNTTSCLSVTVTVIPLPSQPAAISGNTTPISGNTETYSITNVSGVSYTWSAPSGWVGTSNSNSVSFIVGMPNGIVSVIPYNTCGAGIGRSIIIGTGGYQLSGTFTYNNSSNTPLDSIMVYLLLNGSRVDSILTDINGNYQFTNIPNEAYNITAITHKVWNGVNITDAIIVGNHFSGSQLLTSSLSLHSADVNSSLFINITDAIQIARRFVGLTNAFYVYGTSNIKEDWLFEKPTGGSVTNVSPYLNDTVIINGANVIQDFKGICLGEINGSYLPLIGAKSTPKVILNNNNVIKAKANENIDLPIKVNGNLTVGAISLILNYPKELVTINNIQCSKCGENEEIYYNVIGDEIRIGWFNDISPLNLTNGDIIFNISLKTTSKFKQDDVINFKVADNYLCEFANENGVPIENVVININSIVHFSSNKIQTITDDNNEMYIYPNPANSSFKIYLPQKAIYIELLNSLGQVIEKRIVNNKYIQNFEIEENGVYFIKVVTDSKTIIKKIVISR